MASLHALTLLLFLLISTAVAATTTNYTIAKNYTVFVRASCNVTRYPKLCYKTCSFYSTQLKSDPSQLPTLLLSASLSAASSASSSLSKLSRRRTLCPSNAASIKDCIENFSDAVDELRESLEQMADLEGDDVEFKVANVKTWMSAAITDEDTCMDGIGEGDVSDSVRKKIRKLVVKVAQLTSNALAVINHLQYHKKENN